jgi:hypothetical protein
MILEWHDAFHNPMLVDPRITEDTVTDFAGAIGFSVTKQTNSEQGGAGQPATRSESK